MWEMWKDIDGYYGIYQVSNRGRIYSCKRHKVLKLGKDKDGYSKINLSKNRIEKRYSVHRLVLQTFRGYSPKNKNCVNHKNGIKNDNHLENLEWCSNQENVDHANRIGLCDGAKGSNHYKTKLSNKDILNIRKEYLKGNTTLKHLGKKYKVAFSTIGRIISKATWKSV